MITKVLWVLILRIQINFSKWMIFKYGICELWRWNASVQLSPSVMSNYLQPHVLQHARLPYPSPIPRACSNSSPSSLWCHPTISFSVILFSLFHHSFPVSGSYPMSQFFPSDGQNIGASASASVLSMNNQGWFFKNWPVWSPCGLRNYQESSENFETINSLALSLLYNPNHTSIHD